VSARERCSQLKLVFEAAEKRQQEREEQRETARAQKEEERVQKNCNEEQERAADDEDEFGRALAKAQRELAIAQRGTATDDGSNSAPRLIWPRRRNVASVDAQAGVDKSWPRVRHLEHRCVFGHGVVKIGMTRRLRTGGTRQRIGGRPPFRSRFDIHALVYCDDAPGLETKLHTKFWEKRVNWANDRKEFFRVTLEELQSALVELGWPATCQPCPRQGSSQTVVGLRAVSTADCPRPPSALEQQALRSRSVRAEPKRTYVIRLQVLERRDVAVVRARGGLSSL